MMLYGMYSIYFLNIYNYISDNNNKSTNDYFMIVTKTQIDFLFYLR